MVATPTAPLLVMRNDTQSTLAVAISSGGQTTLTVATGDGATKFASLPADLLVTYGGVAEEMVATDRTGDVLTVTRGVGGTTLTSAPIGTPVEIIVGSAVFDYLNAAVRRSPLVTLSVDQQATGGIGTSGDPWTGWETAVNAAAAHSRIYFPAGYYTQTTAINAKLGWVLEGAGQDATFIKTSSNIEQITWLTTSNSGTVGTPANAWCSVRDLQLECTHATPTKTGIYLMCAVGAWVERVTVLGHRWGIVLDGAEVCMVRACRLESQKNSGAGVMLANGNEYWASRTGGAMTEFVTNRNTIQDCQFNQTVGTCSGVYDDGGLTLHIKDCNFNGGLYGIAMYGRQGALIQSCQFESTAGAPINFAGTKFDASSLGTVVLGNSSGICILANYVIPLQAAGVSTTAAIQAVNIVGVETVRGLVVLGNQFICTAGVSVVQGGAELTGVIWLGNNNPGSAAAVFDANPAGHNNLFLDTLSSATAVGLGLGGGFTAAGYGASDGAIHIPTVGTAPSVAPTGGLALWFDGVNLKCWKPGGGSATTIV